MQRGFGRRASVGARQGGASPKRERPEVDGVFPLMPQQYYDLIARRHVVDGERRLLFAVFEDAIRSYVLNLNGKSIARQKEFLEVQEWISVRGHHNLFSFDSLCTMFGVDPDVLRKQLATLKASALPRRRIGSVGRRVPLSATL